ncbi:MAG: CoA-binding protein [Chloroflexi bacterium]|nr:CoA-binding protein [Chloroflexota bacterium]
MPEYLQLHGCRIIPVNPALREGLGQTVYPDLLAIPEPVDVVQIFRKPEDVPAVVEQAIQIGAKVVWMQIGSANPDAARAAQAAGLRVVMDHCMMIGHKRLFGPSACES